MAYQEREAQRLKIPQFSRMGLGGDVFIDLVLIPAGTFPMGSPSERTNPPRIVRISRAFLISMYEVTWRQFLCLVEKTDMDLMTQGDIKYMQTIKNWLDYPAEVDWLLSEKFCNNLSKREGIKARLPTEAEWEYACRAGTIRLFGESDSIDETKANIAEWPGPNGKRIYSARGDISPVPGGRYDPNHWGVHDMMGNLDEWCLDVYSDRADISKLSPVDPVLNTWGSLFRVKRGGSWHRAKTVFNRTGDATSNPGSGIRLVIEIDEAIRSKLVPRVPKGAATRAGSGQGG